jgi:hypothetical protein
MRIKIPVIYDGAAAQPVAADPRVGPSDQE